MAPMPPIQNLDRYVALGDSFTEGVGDPEPARPNGLRGWADRVAEVLATPHRTASATPTSPSAGASCAGSSTSRSTPALALEPDLVSIHAGANDVLRPRVDLDDLAAAYDEGVGRLAATGARVVMFTIFDPGRRGIYAADARPDGDLQRVRPRDQRPARRPPSSTCGGCATRRSPR